MMSYDNYRQALLNTGLSISEVEKVIDKNTTDDRSLNMGLCPKCGAEIDKTIDPSQRGPTLIEGAWVNYNCKTCGFVFRLARRTENTNDNRSNW